MAKVFLFPTNTFDVLDDNDVTTSKINALAVTTAKIDALAVTTAKIDAEAVTAAKVDVDGTFGNFVFSADVLRAGAPTAANAVATKSYVDSAVSGITDPKESVRVATTNALVATRSGNVLTANANGSINTSGIDSVTTLALNDRVLVKDQGAGADNGIYYITDLGSAGTPYVLTRSTDADSSAEVNPGMYVFVEEGTINADNGWLLITDAPITLNTTALVFTQFSGAGSIIAGAGLTKTGNTLDVGAGNGIIVNADDIEVQFGATPDIVDVDAGADSGGTQQKSARADHKHTVLTGTPVTIGTANAAGTIDTLARADHVHNHGSQTDGTHHAVADDTTAGFLSSADFLKLADEYQATVQTTSATPVTLFTYAVATARFLTIEATISAYDTGGSGDSASYTIIGYFQRGGGSPVQKGNTVVLSIFEDQASWDADFDINSNDVRIRVTGSSATINWKVNLRVTVAAT